MTHAPSLGIVIPTLNEATLLPGLLDDLAQIDVERTIVVADGGSTDATVSIAEAAGATVVTAPAGRGPQLNAGARALDTEWICFLHADVRMPAAARRALVRSVSDGVDVAVWSLRIADPGTWARVMEAGARMRDRYAGLPYGDQGLLLRRVIFESVGGFPELPIMEDVALVRTLRRRGRIERFDASLEVSPRRWLREGPYRTWLRNSVLLTAFLFGVPAERLARWYRSEPA